MNANKIEETRIKRKAKKGNNEWRSAKKSESLLSDFEDIKRRKQLSNTEMAKISDAMAKIWQRYCKISVILDSCFPRHWETRLVSSRFSLISWGEVPLGLVGHSSSDVVKIKILYGVDIFLHRPASHLFLLGWLKLNLIISLDQLLKGSTLNNFESHNSLKLNFTNI